MTTNKRLIVLKCIHTPVYYSPLVEATSAKLSPTRNVFVFFLELPLREVFNGKSEFKCILSVEFVAFLLINRKLACSKNVTLTFQ